MMDNQSYQCLMLKSIKSPSILDSNIEYHRQLIKGRYIGRIRDIALWWRNKQIADLLPLSSKYLKRKCLFDDLIEEYYSANSISPYMEKNAIQFMEFISSKDDNLASCLSQFEIAMLDVVRGKAVEFEIRWPCNFHVFLESMMNGIELVVDSRPCWVRVSDKIEGGVGVIEY